MVAADQELVGLCGNVQWAKLEAAIVVEPCDVPVLVLVLIELFKFDCDGLHLWRQRAFNLALLGPVPVCEDFCDELDLELVSDGARLGRVLEFEHEVLGESDIFEHGAELVHSVVAALDSELLQHELLCLLGEGGLVQETNREVLGVSLDEDVSAVEAAEQSDDRVKSSIDGGIFVDTLESLGELIVAVGGNKCGGHALLVHEGLERYVAVLLELDVILEALLYHAVHLCLEGQEPRGKLDGVLDEGLVHDDLVSSRLNVRLHLLDDVLEGALDSAEHLVHEGQLLELAVLEHGVAAGSLLVNQVWRLLLYDLGLDSIQERGFGLGL